MPSISVGCSIGIRIDSAEGSPAAKGSLGLDMMRYGVKGFYGEVDWGAVLEDTSVFKQSAKAKG